MSSTRWHCGGGRRRAVARDHDRLGRHALGGAAIGGTVDKFTGDGSWPSSGRPRVGGSRDSSLPGSTRHPKEIARLAAEVSVRDGVDFALRVGLNSGQVIAGEVGSSSLGYTTIGEQVGIAQRMESVAPPGGVMLSDSTARLVEHAAVLGEPERVTIKGSDEPWLGV